jgi:hypothetical protein
MQTNLKKSFRTEIIDTNYRKKIICTIRKNTYLIKPAAICKVVFNRRVKKLFKNLISFYFMHVFFSVIGKRRRNFANFILKER